MTGKRLIQGLLLAAKGRALGASHLVAAGSLFGISENSVRVTLTRLSTEGRIESAGRGTYRVGPAARAVSDDVAGWRQSERRLRAWDGDFVVVHTNPLGRSDRISLRRRGRALDMVGFRELERGLFVRPNNVEREVEAVRQRLFGLGLEPSCTVLAGSCFDGDARRRIDTLWDTRALDAHYRDEREHLEAWMDRAAHVDLDVAARESYLLGNQAIRSVVFDPWLPAPFVDVDARHAFFETVCAFDELGQAIWSRLTTSLAPTSVAIQEQSATRH